MVQFNKNFGMYVFLQIRAIYAVAIVTLLQKCKLLPILKFERTKKHTWALWMDWAHHRIECYFLVFELARGPRLVHTAADNLKKNCRMNYARKILKKEFFSAYVCVRDAVSYSKAKSVQCARWWFKNFFSWVPFHQWCFEVTQIKKKLNFGVWCLYLPSSFGMAWEKTFFNHHLVHHWPDFFTTTWAWNVNM